MAQPECILLWVTPDGLPRTALEPHDLRDAGKRVAYVLYDNRAASRREAQRFAAGCVKAWRIDPRANMEHESGYVFALREV